ncbi:MAG: SIS domain-containing protein [Bryobacterales bacterium]|nr:SIS domain-containing protein [Bryobacterales bacterium]
MQKTTDSLRSLAARATFEEVLKFLDESLSSSAAISALAGDGEGARIEAGYGHTLREIAQQPFVWADTALRAREFVETVFVPRLVAQSFRSIAFVGSGSSHYAGEVAAPVLQERLGLPVRAVPAGDLLTHGKAALPLPEPVLLVSIARSGNSPESVAAIRIAASEAPQTQFIHITCNSGGRLAEPVAGDPGAATLALHPFTNDQSLVMTSSFTSLTLAALALGYAEAPAAYITEAERLATHLAARFPAVLANASQLADVGFDRAMFLGSGPQYGAAREAALKLTEMTAGSIVALAESHLGLRHGPMAAIDDHTLIASFTPPQQRARRYAIDLIAECRLKGLGARTVEIEAGGTAGEPENSSSASTHTPEIGEGFAAIENVAFGQMLAFFACRGRGLRPDTPSAAGVIARVVPPFPTYVDLSATGSTH